MANLFQSDRVKLVCSCGKVKPIISVYFCRHCFKLRCSNCVSHELDTLFCPNCFENMPSTEARLKKNRCANCFDCPSCGHTLTTRAASIQAPSEEVSKTFTRKVYYLACTSCRWCSRDVGLKDQPVATGGWAEQDSPHYNYLQNLMEYYRAVAQKDKSEKEKKKYPHKKAYDRYGLSPFLGKKSLSTSLVAKTDLLQMPDITPLHATEEVEGLKEDIFIQPVNLSEVTTLEQRLWSPEWQPEHVKDLYPLHKHILVKKSLRCRCCEHNLSKPEYNPSSVKFKIQLSAFYHVPEVRLVNPITLKWGNETAVQISLCNPTLHDMNVALLPFVPEAHFERIRTEMKEESLTLSSTNASLSCTTEIPMERIEVLPNSDVTLPQGQLVLAARDDTAEYDDQEFRANFKDDDQVVAWRRANKVGVNLLVVPAAGVKACLVGFLLRYNYTNMVATSSESRTVTLNIPVIVHVGDVEE